MKKVVLLSIELVKRDLDSRLLLADRLADAGYTVYIGYARKIFSLLCFFQNSIYIGRFMSLGGSAVDKKVLDICYKNNNQFHYLHDEGGFLFSGDYKGYSKIIYPLEYLRHPAVTSILFWGKKQFDALKDEMNQSLLSKSFVTGKYRFEMYKSKELIDDIPETNDIVLMGRFSEPNPIADDIKPFTNSSLEIFTRSMLKDKSNSFLKEMMKSWIKSTQEYTHFIDLIFNIATRYPDKKIVIRPHPAESHEIYNFFINFFPNITLDSNSDVRDTIIKSKIIVHTECTTGIESCLIQKPTINFRPLEGVYPEYEVSGAKHAGIICTNIDEVFKQIDSFFNGVIFKFQEPKIEELLSNFNSNVSAYDNIFEVLKNFQIDSKSSYSIISFFKNLTLKRLRFFIGDIFRLSTIKFSSKNLKNKNLTKVNHIKIRNKIVKKYNLIKVSR